MADVTWLPSSSVEETVAQLNDLFARDRQRRAESVARTRYIAVGLDSVGSGTDDVEPGASPPRSGGRGVRSAGVGPAPDPAPFVALPRITGGSGPFGPKVRAKLTAELLAKRGW
jgi:hypothetical protein